MILYMKNLICLLIFLPMLCLCAGPDSRVTPLMRAAETGNLPALEKFVGHTWIEFSDEQGYTALMHAILAGQLESVKFLVEHGANVNMRNSFNGDSTLMYAATQGNPDIVNYLISQHVQIEFRNTQNETALIKAAAAGNASIALTLLDHGAHFNRCTNAGLNAYMTAKKNQQTDTAKQLQNYAKQHQLNVNACDKERFPKASPENIEHLSS